MTVTVTARCPVCRPRRPRAFTLSCRPGLCDVAQMRELGVSTLGMCAANWRTRVHNQLHPSRTSAMNKDQVKGTASRTRPARCRRVPANWSATRSSKPRDCKSKSLALPRRPSATPRNWSRTRAHTPSFEQLCLVGRALKARPRSTSCLLRGCQPRACLFTAYGLISFAGACTVYRNWVKSNPCSFADANAAAFSVAANWGVRDSIHRYLRSGFPTTAQR